ncbi:MAG: DNA-binding response regulator [Bacteroidetes bacterium CG_4_10_14_3_um_filter_42_6]|nr:MAG: DNA-binding response regulator [Bacteroidetes bacterium CG_4_10_14_3_um_filter_42_6]
MIEIAIVEDIDDIRESLKAYIHSTEGIECMATFADAESAIEFLTKHPVDVVLMDIQLPGMNGIECIKKLKTVHPKMMYIMSTIFQDDKSVFNALKAGATGYLLKNDNPAKIISAIWEVHSGGSPMTPQIARRVIESFNQPAVNEVSLLLTKRETELLGYLAKGFRYKEIADKLFISTETVRKHINNIYQKLHVQSRMDAVNKVFGNRD